MKRAIALLLVLILCVGLCACSESDIHDSVESVVTAYATGSLAKDMDLVRESIHPAVWATENMGEREVSDKKAEVKSVKIISMEEGSSSKKEEYIEKYNILITDLQRVKFEVYFYYNGKADTTKGKVYCGLVDGKWYLISG